MTLKAYQNAQRTLKIRAQPNTGCSARLPARCIDAQKAGAQGGPLAEAVDWNRAALAHAGGRLPR